MQIYVRNILKKVLPFFFVLFMSANSCQPDTEVDRSICSNGLELISNFQRIKNDGILRVITNYNSIDYFAYRGTPMGYQIELLESLSDYLGVKLEVIVENDLEKSFESLINHENDLIAASLTVTKERSNYVSFTKPYTNTRQVLIQKRPQNWQKMKRDQLEGQLLRNQLDLAGKTVHVQKNSAFYDRLMNLSEEIGNVINIVEIEDVSSEEIISLVANGEIEYAVCDENVAKVNTSYYPEIDANTAISFPQNLAWAVRKDSPQLLSEINNWMDGFTKTRRYALIYNKYFKNTRSAYIKNSQYCSINGGSVSVYDNLIKMYSKEIGWDWRLLASLIYQESRFNPQAESWAGAYGLMQLMPPTAERFGAVDPASPRQNIRAGVKFIKWLEKYYANRIENPDERLKFILAAYNVGPGHVIDACRLAKKNGKNPNVWKDNVDFYLLQKSKPKYYTDPVVKHGYCRGEEPYKYVTEILERYEHYKNVIDN